MTPHLIQIHPATQSDTPRLPTPFRYRLETLYDRLPGVTCACDKLGQCCELTPYEVQADFATMYPLYTVEYLNIVDYVRNHFDPERQAELLSITEERPTRCPFLTETGGCSIHLVRPLVCRSYGVLTREQVEQVASDARGRVPQHWIASFLYIERHTICPHTTLAEPEKVTEHAEAMISFQYERDLIDMGREAGALEEGRKAVLEGVARFAGVTRWTWGGFNVLMRAPLSWLKSHFDAYWEACILAE